MKLIRNCGVPIGVTCAITCFLEIILSGGVGALCLMSWVKEGSPKVFVYESESKGNYLQKNKDVENCVILWCLSIIAVVGIWRIISAVVLLCSVRRNSAGMAQYWIMFKVLALMLSTFVAIASFTVPAIKEIALASLLIDAITSYFIYILYPELERMERAILVPKNKESSVESDMQKS